MDIFQQKKSLTMEQGINRNIDTKAYISHQVSMYRFNEFYSFYYCVLIIALKKVFGNHMQPVLL